MASKNFPFGVHEIDTKQVDELKNYFRGMSSTCELRCGTEGYAFLRKFENIGSDIYNMEVRPDDTFVLSFPKSGTTWTQDMVWLIANNFDFEKAIETPLPVRFPFIDMQMFVSTAVSSSEHQYNPLPDDKLEKLMHAIPDVEQVLRMPSPRFIKSHIPLSLLPPNLLDTCKVVYVARDPRDVAVSYFHHEKLLKTANDGNDFKSYWNFFVRDLLLYTPFFSHVKEAWVLRNHPNMLFLFYEELSKDLAACACRVAKFLGKEITAEHLHKLCEHLNIKNFKKNKSVNLQDLKDFGLLNENESFIRKGKVGGWIDYFDEEMTEQAQRWINENLRDTDLRFPS